MIAIDFELFVFWGLLPILSIIVGLALGWHSRQPGTHH